MDIQQLFAETARREASDLHLVVGSPPVLRVAGKLFPVQGESILTPDDTQRLIVATLNEQQKELLTTNRELDYSIGCPSGRFRANVYYQKGSLAGAFRLISSKIKSMAELGLPQICMELVKMRQGLILVTGPTGHGKSTSIASMIQHINTTRAEHIVTIEDPVEYVFAKGLSIISQREMHGDTLSWNVALRSVLREDPDIVFVGEMRDFETIQAAITVAETGHLVFATLHTNSAAQSVDRVIDVFPENQQLQVRLQMSSVIGAIISQRLVPNTSGGRSLAAEVLTATPAIKTLVREGKTHQIDNIIQTSAEFGMMTLETSLATHVRAGTIQLEVARSYALRPDDLERSLRSSS
ncbi:type IV pilus twitching motility protein PilT [Patescibacteria group bacterium]|nr:type IV pilus twitching motility protein PilT [Patescibacteria group bacterium]MBU1472438.1 type IV pilus twitching motility protein PilT [Patescibacteria group bacterium]MBU2460253.1 type IV pilus twitching motility protein PilT [Patescibacteria group bacterium]MBU2544722.1 type IV pilus twitching motility protein PilT [Patescibacteria group bacterium]